jgi:hypothetical protein
MDDFRLNNEGLPAEPDSDAVTRSSRKSSGSNSSEWLVNVEDDVVVPMITSEIVAAFRAGRVAQRSLVWRIGMHDWSALAEVPQLRLAVGPSALPAATSTPGPIVHAAPTVAPDQPRRSTLPFGFPALRDAASVREPSGFDRPAPAASTPQPSKSAPVEDGEAIAVYERPAPSLTFAESMRDEWQGRPSSPAASAARLTPVPPASSRLGNRAPHSLAPNTLSPTTAEAARADSARRLGAFGDKSVVFASELRAAKKTSKRVALWAALGSAAVASIATFLIARSEARPADQVPVAPPAAAAVRDVPAVLSPAPESAPTLASAAPVASAAPAPSAAKQAAVRVVKRAKPAPVRVAPPAPEPVDSADPSDDTTDDAKPSVAASLPLAAAVAPTPAASAAAPVASAPASAEHVAPTPGF